MGQKITVVYAYHHEIVYVFTTLDYAKVIIQVNGSILVFAFSCKYCLCMDV